MKPSDGLGQNTATVGDALLCAYMSGIAPYSAMDSSSSYSKTSRLYRRYGSEYAALSWTVALSEN